MKKDMDLKMEMEMEMAVVERNDGRAPLQVMARSAGAARHPP